MATWPAAVILVCLTIEFAAVEVDSRVARVTHRDLGGLRMWPKVSGSAFQGGEAWLLHVREGVRGHIRCQTRNTRHRGCKTETED